jgi:hypothetical protein
VDVADSVVGAAANRADRETVTTSARAARECDVSYEQLLVDVFSQEDIQILTARVNGDTVILVVDDSVGDGNTGRASDIEGICIISENRTRLSLMYGVRHTGIVTKAVSGRAVDGDLVHGQSLGSVDGEGLDRRVLNGKSIAKL